jgi:hypothetical protein
MLYVNANLFKLLSPFDSRKVLHLVQCTLLWGYFLQFYICITYVKGGNVLEIPVRTM